VLAVVIPLGALALGIRRELDRRLTREYQDRVASTVRVIEADLARESGTVGIRLHAMASQIARDNRIRLALQGDPGNRSYLLDYAGQSMRLSGLSMLQIQDSTGRILSSGHFRNQFDQVEATLPRLLAATADTLVLVRTRTPEAPLLAFVRIDSVRLAGRALSLIGGIEATRRLPAGVGDSSRDVALLYSGDSVAATSARRVVRAVRVPYLDLLARSEAPDTARLVVTQSLESLEGLRRSVNRWFLVALALTLLAAVLAAAWISGRISRPLQELAQKTSQVDLDRLDQNFETERSDEIGVLSRLLAAMMERLRASSVRLREVERRAAVGDVARQVNHDIKNGLAPIRNVLRHLTQVLRQSPASLPEVFEARRGTLESSVEYLDTLARNYDRLAPGLERGPCDVNAIVHQVVRNAAHDGTVIQARLSPQLPPALGDSLIIRRILENLVGNALDSVALKPEGVVTVSTEWVPGATDPGRVRISVGDTGVGMTKSELDRAFDDFYTTKAGGTGLGLSIVRRLILDLDGTLRVDTEPGKGTQVTVELPSGSPAGAGR
jgi:signal transduction histidine kinase